MNKKVIGLAIVCLLGISISANSFYKSNIEDTINKWLIHIGFNATVQEVAHTYDSDNFIDTFHIVLAENPKVSTQSVQKIQRDVTTYIEATIPSESNFEFVELNIINKDIQDIPYMYTDWIGKLVITYALKKVCTILGLPLQIKKINAEQYQATILPSKTTVASRYRFDKITAIYSLDQLILSASLRVYAKANYLPLQFVKSELHAILRALEAGSFPGSKVSTTLASQLPEGSLSDYLLHELLGTDTKSYSNPEELEHNLPLEDVEDGQVLSL